MFWVNSVTRIYPNLNLTGVKNGIAKTLSLVPSHLTQPQFPDLDVTVLTLLAELKHQYVDKRIKCSLPERSGIHSVLNTKV